MTLSLRFRRAREDAARQHRQDVRRDRAMAVVQLERCEQDQSRRLSWRSDPMFLPQNGFGKNRIVPERPESGEVNYECDLVDVVDRKPTFIESFAAFEPEHVAFWDALRGLAVRSYQQYQSSYDSDTK